ncbi:hypothetical protein FOZ63_002887, partial [Perkinsus olseni]
MIITCLIFVTYLTSSTEVLARADGSPLGSAQASSPSRLRHSDSEAKAGGGRDSERPSAELESLLEEASKFKKWMDDEGSSLQREGRLPLGLHLLPLIDLDDLERMGDLPSLPESFEMAQASAVPAPAAPSSFLDSGRGGKGNFWETVNLPQDLVAEVMKRMTKHHRHRSVPRPEHGRAWLLNRLATLAAVLDAEKAHHRGFQSLGDSARRSASGPPPDAFHDTLVITRQEAGWRDFMGPCSAFVPFAKAVLVGDLGIDECWRRCTQQYFFCTQVRSGTVKRGPSVRHTMLLPARPATSDMASACYCKMTVLPAAEARIELALLEGRWTHAGLSRSWASESSGLAGSIADSRRLSKMTYPIYRHSLWCRAVSG